MPQSKISYQEFIQNSFSPSVGVMCSALVDITCKKNNLSFTEMVQPFCKLNEATYKDPSGSTITLNNFRINISDVNSRPPQPTMARKFLNESVSLHVNERTNVVEVGGLRLDVPVSAPWFEAWRETFLQVQFPSDHEFTKHYLACILVVSSAEANPLDTITQMGSQLKQMVTVSPAKLPKWFSHTVLRYYVLLHDNTDGNMSLAESLFETMKTTYGVNSVFFLNLNSQAVQSVDSHLPDPWTQFLSRKIHTQLGDVNEVELEMMRNSVEPAQEAGETTPVTPVIAHPLSPVTNLQPDTGFTKSVVDEGGSHGGCLTVEDLDKIREFVTSFCLICLIPHVEQQIQQLTDIMINRKGMSKSFLSATKRWFGTSKPGLATSPTLNITYTHDSPELQLRRLGDLCFMFGAYSLAFTAYHAAKRDFNADGAWLYYAGGLEMAALSLFMQPMDPTRKALEYAEESIHTYLNSCRLPQFATRATLWTSECLRGRGQTGEAARQLIRMTSEDSDLRSALLLEQAAYCFLAAPRPPMPRKYAFHLVLAGHRFSKAGQRRHSLRSYRQAFQVYEGKHWSLSEDHIQHTIGRQALGLKLVTEAAEAFSLLLPRSSRQSPAQQSTFLREYISTQQQLNLETRELPLLPLPVVDHNSIQVLLGRPPPRAVDDGSVLASGVSFDLQPDDAQRWMHVAEQLVMAAAGVQPTVFRPNIELLNNMTNNANPSTTYVGETVCVSVSLTNPLHIPITLIDLRLLWSFTPHIGGDMMLDNSNTAKDSSAVVTQVTQRLVIPADMSTKVIQELSPQQVGQLKITGIGYALEGGDNRVLGRQLLVPQGRRLRSVKDDGSLFTADHRLTLKVEQSAPALRVSFQGLVKDMLCGELTSVTVNCENCGNVDVTRLLVSCATPNIVSLGRPHSSRGGTREVPLPHPLAPGQSLQVPMQVRAHDVKGSFTIDLFFYYENSLYQVKPLYRLVRHSWPVQVHDSLQVSVSPARSAIFPDQEETLNLRVQVQNVSQSHESVKCEVCMTRAALHSPQWQIMRTTTHPAVMSLTPQELAQFLVKVRRKENASADLSELMLINNAVLSVSPDFLPSFEDEPTDTAVSQDRALDNVLALQATLIILWKASVETRGGDTRQAVGQHHVSLSCLGTTSWWPPPSPTTTTPSPLRIFGSDTERRDSLVVRQRLVTFSVMGGPTSTSGHPFTANRVCIIPVEVIVRNCCDCQLEVKVEASDTSISSGKDYSVMSYQWVGCTRRLLRLVGHHSGRIKMAIGVGAAGTYDLSSRLKVCARRLTDTEFVTQTWRSDSILVVS